MCKSPLSLVISKSNWTAFVVKISICVVGFVLWQSSAIAQGASSSATATSGRQLTMPAAFQVDYTGALFGYYRIEPKEKPEAGQKAVLAPVNEFLKRRAGLPQQLLLGMGDNFGPEFGSSVQMQPLNQNHLPDETDHCFLKLTKGSQDMKDREEGKAYPQILYKDSERVLGDKQVDCDSVANFLMTAGYRALVPGREDFLYGATWLRGIALGLRWASLQNSADLIKNNDHKLHMLAANLRVTGSGGDGKGAKEAEIESTGKAGNSAVASKPKIPQGGS